MASPYIAWNKDKQLIVTKALPAAASTSVATDGIDIGDNGRAVDIVVDVPALSTTILPNASTSTTTVEASTDAAFTSPVVILSAVQTGAGGIGASALAARASIPPLYRYARARVAFGASTTTGAALSVTAAIVV